MKLRLVNCIVSVFAVLALGSAYAAPKKGEPKSEDTKKAPAKEEGAKKDTYPLYGKVVSINTRTLTIKGGVDKPDRKYSVNAETVYTNGDKKATLDDVKPGGWVGGQLKKAEGDGNDVVLKLNVGVKQKDEGESKEPAKGEGKSPAKKK